VKNRYSISLKGSPTLEGRRGGQKDGRKQNWVSEKSLKVIPEINGADRLISGEGAGKRKDIIRSGTRSI